MVLFYLHFRLRSRYGEPLAHRRPIATTCEMRTTQAAPHWLLLFLEFPSVLIGLNTGGRVRLRVLVIFSDALSTGRSSCPL